MIPGKHRPVPSNRVSVDGEPPDVEGGEQAESHEKVDQATRCISEGRRSRWSEGAHNLFIDISEKGGFTTGLFRATFLLGFPLSEALSEYASVEGQSWMERKGRTGCPSFHLRHPPCELYVGACRMLLGWTFSSFAA